MKYFLFEWFDSGGDIDIIEHDVDKDIFRFIYSNWGRTSLKHPEWQQCRDCPGFFKDREDGEAKEYLKATEITKTEAFLRCL